MSNGNIVAEIRTLIKNGNPVPAKVRDRLILAAIADIYEKLDEQAKLIPWMKAWKWTVALLGPVAIVGIVSFIISILTHQILISFP